MEGIGDYIYLIILALAGLSGLLKKKKPANADQDQAPAKPKRTWEDVLRELTPIDQEEIVKEKEIAKAKEVKVENVEEPIKRIKVEPSPYISYETSGDKSSMKARKQVSQLKSSTKSAPLEVIEVVPTRNFLTDFKLDSPEDARRAFVYSEIFNRKY